MLSSFLSLLMKDFKLILRNKQLMIVCFTVPFILLTIFSYIFSNGMERAQGPEPINAAVVDNEDSMISRILIQSFNDNKSFSGYIRLQNYSEEEAEEKLKKGEITAIIRIPRGFTESVYYCENYAISVTVSASSPLKAEILKSMLEGYSRYIASVESSIYSSYKYIDNLKIDDKTKNLMNEDLSKELVYKALAREGIFDKRIYNDIPSSSSQEYYIISILIVFLMYIGISSGNFIIYDKNNRCLDRIMTAPYGAPMAILSKWVSFFIFSFLYSLLFISVPLFLYELYIGVEIRSMLIFVALCIGFVDSLFIFLGIVFKREEEYMLFCNIIVLITAVIGGCFIPLYMMPPVIQKLSMLTPEYWMIRGLLYLLNDYGLRYILQVISVMGILSVILLCFSIFSVERKVVGYGRYN